MPDLDRSSWLTKQQAADSLGVSTKAIERFAQAGKLEQAKRRQPGTPDVVVYFPDDVRDLAAQRQRGAGVPFLVPAGAAIPTNGNGHGPQTPEGLTRVLPPVASGADLLTLLVSVFQRVVSETSETVVLSPEELDAQYVTLPEAARIKGRTVTWLRRQIAAGSLRAEKDQGWRIQRRDLKAL